MGGRSHGGCHQPVAPAAEEGDEVAIGGLVGGVQTAARLTVEPGWKWSECVKPVVGTDSCQVHHVGFIQSGTMHVAHDDGTELDLGPGSAYEILPGHDAWVVGGETCLAFEFESRAAEEYAR